MSIKGFSVGGVVQRYDYTALDNLPQGQGVSDDLKAALLQLAQKVAYIDDQGQTYYDDLYDALYPEKTLLSIAADFQQGQAVVYNTDSLDSLKQYLTVTAIYDDASTETVPSSAYTLSGTLTTGTSVITVTYEGKTDAFNVTVTAAPMALTVTNNLTGCTTSNSATSVLQNSSYTAVITASSGYTLVGATVSITMGGQDITTSAYSGGIITINNVTGALVISVAAVAVVLNSISAVYTQSGTVYDTDTLDSLKDNLVVTAVYSDSSTQTVPAADYVLSGTLTAGTSTITVSYGGKTTTFNVTVTEAPLLPTEYQQVEYIKATGTQYMYTGLTVYDHPSSTNTNSIDKYTIDIDFQFDEWQTNYASNIMAGFGAAAGKWIGYANSVGNIAMGTSSGMYFSGTPTDRHQYRYEAFVSGNKATWTRDDGATITRAFTGTNGDIMTLSLFYVVITSGTQNDFHFNGKLFACAAYKLGEKVMDLIPCYRKADGEIGLYDTVGNHFYTNEGSGTFLKGADVA